MSEGLQFYDKAYALPTRGPRFNYWHFQIKIFIEQALGKT